MGWGEREKEGEREREKVYCFNIRIVQGSLEDNNFFSSLNAGLLFTCSSPMIIFCCWLSWCILPSNVEENPFEMFVVTHGLSCKANECESL